MPVLKEVLRMETNIKCDGVTPFFHVQGPEWSEEVLNIHVMSTGRMPGLRPLTGP